MHLTTTSAWGRNLNQRDTIAVRRMIDGYLKLMYPNGEFTKEELEEIIQIALEMRRRVKEQLKKLGSSCDWTRERFTMDEGCSKAVKEVFIKYYEEGLIYRGKRIINWCPKCLTSISDAEVEYEVQAGHFWHLRYPLKDGSGYLELATTRPETLLGDAAVAVNPNDERYKDLVGKTLILPLVHREIPHCGRRLLWKWTSEPAW